MKEQNHEGRSQSTAGRVGNQTSDEQNHEGRLQAAAGLADKVIAEIASLQIIQANLIMENKILTTQVLQLTLDLEQAKTLLATVQRERNNLREEVENLKDQLADCGTESVRGPEDHELVLAGQQSPGLPPTIVTGQIG